MLRAGRVHAIRNQPAENIPGFAYGLLVGGEQCAHDCRPQLPLLLAVAHSSWAAEGLIAVSVLSFCPGGGNAVICWLWQIARRAKLHSEPSHMCSQEWWRRKLLDGWQRASLTVRAFSQVKAEAGRPRAQSLRIQLNTTTA